MTLTIDFWQLLGLIFSGIGALWAVVKVTATQAQAHLDERFEAQEKSRTENHAAMDKRLNAIETTNRQEAGNWQRMEREILQLKAELPLNYVRREDYVRGQSIVEAKLDGLATKIDNAQLRVAAIHDRGSP